MTDEQYIRHFSVLGKLAYLYDLAAASVPDLSAGLANYLDQISNADPAVNDIVIALTMGAGQINSAITTGPGSIKSVCLQEANRYLTSAAFRTQLTTVPVSPNASDVLAALQTEMGAGEDDKTLSTLSSTGLVNLFNTILGEAGTWNTEADATADYPDSVYVVSAVVADP